MLFRSKKFGCTKFVQTKFDPVEVIENIESEFGGASRDRTDDLIVANDALSQLSYSPTLRKETAVSILPAVPGTTKLDTVQRLQRSRSLWFLFARCFLSLGRRCCQRQIVAILKFYQITSVALVSRWFVANDGSKSVHMPAKTEVVFAVPESI